MPRQRKIHLFNCDHLYELRVIEDLLNSSKPMLYDKLGFEFTVEHHYFSLTEMAELIEKVIPALQMDFAVFVVHAHESRLSINDGRGYTRVYRALLQSTGDNVIIVIGGDDNYKNEYENEVEQSVLSPWARRIVSVQFSKEYLDGRKSFVFSWDKKHRPIHEEALMHFFDPDKKGERFICQLPKKADPASMNPRQKTPAETIPTEEEEKCPSDVKKTTEQEDMDEDENIQQPLEYFKAVTPTYTEHGPLKGKLLLKSKLRHGRISHAPEDVEFLSPDFLGLADHKTQWFPEKYRHIDEIQLKIMLVENKPLLCIGDPGIEMGDNDLLLLKTRVRKGLVSFHNDDLEIRYPGWKIPVHILEDLQRNASNGKLFIISDEKGHLRCSVRSGVTEVANRLVGVRDKAFEFITSNVFKTTL